MSNPPSPTILQRYHLLRKIATGGMAEVHLAEQTGAGGFKKRVAIKRILPSFAQDQKFVEMFLDEARLAAMFHHPNLIQIYELGEMDGLLCLIMEYVRGPSLSALTKRTYELGQTVPMAMAARIVAEAAEGLQYAHDFADPDTGQPLGLVHRDVSPQNILVSMDGIAKVMDFGIAKAAGQIHHTSTGTLKGKLAYMPPEQLNGLPLDRRADIWALGVVLYELLAGRRPFVGDSEASVFRAILLEPLQPLEQLAPEVPAALLAAVSGALTRDVGQRTKTAGALARQLEDWLQGQPRTGQAEVAAWLKPLFAMADEASAGFPQATPLERQKPPQQPPTKTLSAGDGTVKLLPVTLAGTSAPPRRRSLPWRTVAAAATVTVLAGVGFVAWRTGSEPTAQREERALPPTPPPAAPPLAAALQLAPPAVTPPSRPPEIAPSAPGPAARHEKRREPGPRRRALSGPASAEAQATTMDSVPRESPPPETSGPMGSLVVNTEPWSRVTIDGRDFGQTPLAGVPLKPGRHEMVCTNPDNGLVHRETVVIPPGGRIKRFFQLAGGE